MGILKKKEKKDEKKGSAVELVMHSRAELNADEDGEYCYAIFQTEKPLTPAEWQHLAQKAREGATFTLDVLDAPPEPPE